MKNLLVTLALLCVGLTAAQAQSLPAADPRLLVDINPAKAFNSYPANQFAVQLGMDRSGKNQETEIRSIAEPGYLDWRINDYTVRRDTFVGVPVFRHMLKEGMSYRNDGTYMSGRASIMSRWGASNPVNLKNSTPYWTAIAIYIDPKSACDDMPMLGHGHSVTSKNVQGTIKLDMRANCQARIWINSSNILDVQDDKKVVRTTYDRGPLAKGVWHYFIFQFKLEWDPAKGPYTRVWHAVGDAAPQQWLNLTIPNVVRESAGYWSWKFGLYKWNVTAWNGNNLRQIYTRGFKVWKDESGSVPLNVTTVLNTIRGTSTPAPCPAKPADETRTQACGSGLVGSFTQTRSYVSAAAPTCWTATEWAPATAPAGACASATETELAATKAQLAKAQADLTTTIGERDALRALIDKVRELVK